MGPMEIERDIVTEIKNYLSWEREEIGLFVD